MSESVEARVARGAAWLDENKPGWERRIDVGKLNMLDCRMEPTLVERHAFVQADSDQSVTTPSVRGRALEPHDRGAHVGGQRRPMCTWTTNHRSSEPSSADGCRSWCRCLMARDGSSAAARATDSLWFRAGQERSECRLKRARGDEHTCCTSYGQPIQPGQVCWYESRAQLRERGCCFCGQSDALNDTFRGQPCHIWCHVDFAHEAVDDYELVVGDVPPLGEG